MLHACSTVEVPGDRKAECGLGQYCPLAALSPEICSEFAELGECSVETCVLRHEVPRGFQCTYDAWVTIFTKDDRQKTDLVSILQTFGDIELIIRGDDFSGEDKKLRLRALSLRLLPSVLVGLCGPPKYRPRQIRGELDRFELWSLPPGGAYRQDQRVKEGPKGPQRA